MRANVAQWNAYCYLKQCKFVPDEVWREERCRTHVASIEVSVCNIAIHGLVMATVVQIAARMAAATHTVDQSLRLVVIVAAASIATVSIVTVPVLMAAHFSEVLVWSLAYAIVGAAPAGADPVYFAFVNYTTLGYGDVIPVERCDYLGQ